MSKKGEWVSVRLTDAERDELERLAELEERSVSGMIRLAIRSLIESRTASA